MSIIEPLLMSEKPPLFSNRVKPFVRFSITLKSAPLSIIPEPILQLVLSYLQPAELGRVSSVDKQMNFQSNIVAELCVKKILRELFVADAPAVLKRLSISQPGLSYKKFLNDLRKKRILVLNGTSKHSSILDIKANKWSECSTAMTQHRAAFSSVWYRGELVVISGNVPGKLTYIAILFYP